MSEEGLEEKESKIKEITMFWETLFPECQDKVQIDKIFKAISGRTKEEFVIRYLEEEKDKDSEIDQIFRDYEQSSYICELEELLVKIREKCRWIYFFAPILGVSFGKLRSIIENSIIIENKEDFLEDIMLQIVQKLINISFRTIVQEIELTRNEGKLKGSNAKERNDYYTDCLLRDKTYLMDTYKSYSEGVRILCTVAENTVFYLGQILKDTESEMANIQERIWGDRNPGKLRFIQVGKGDTHNNGKTVSKLIFENEILIYKPRELTMEQKFQEFINWLKNENEEFKMIYSAKVYGKAECGWMEFVENEECENEEDISEFYYKMGEILAIIYSFNSKDFHYENVIAKGSSPVLIDLETLFHVVLEEKTEDVHSYILDTLYTSVIGSTFLPTLFQNNKTNEIMEVGALGRCKTQISPFKTQVLKEVDTDQVHIEFENKVLPMTKNFPILKGKGVGCQDYLTQVREGFRQVYTWIMKNKTLYLDKVYELFCGEKCRIICKNTNLYTQLLETSNHPSLLYNKVDREVYFHRLGLVINDYETFDESCLFTQEINFMLNEDIPMFYCYSNSNEILFGDDKNTGATCVGTAMNETRKKVMSMDELDLKRQIALINESFIGSKMTVDLVTKTNASFKEYQERNLKPQRLNIVDKISKLCMERAITFRDEASWMGMMGFGDDYYKIVPVGIDLYKGNAGIAIFFFEVAKELNSKQYEEFAKLVTIPVIRNAQLEVQTNTAYSYGAFTGMAGELYLLSYLDKNGQKDLADIKAVSMQLVKNICSNLEHLQGTDLLSGLAGVLGVILTVSERMDEGDKEICKRVAVGMVDMLLQSAVKNADGTVTWMQNEDIGFAHGNAGIMVQLSRYYKLTHNVRILEYIKKGLLFERKHKFDAAEGKWITRSNTHYYSWCNGIGGLLLCKLELIDILEDDKELAVEINRIIEQLIVVGFGNDCSICHGDMGSAAILAYAGDKLGDHSLIEECKIFKENYAVKFIQEKWKRFEYTEDWGLLTGFAGLRLGLLSEPNNIIDIFYLR